MTKEDEKAINSITKENIDYAEILNDRDDDEWVHVWGSPIYINQTDDTSSLKSKKYKINLR